MVKVLLLGISLTGNKGAVSMYKSTIQNLSDLFENIHFYVPTIYPQNDKAVNENPNVTVIDGKTTTLFLKIIPLSILYFFLSKIGIHPKFLKTHPYISALLNSDVVLDLGGITFVDGRTKNLVYNVAMILPPLMFKKRVLKLSQALGPFNRFPNKFFARWILPQLEYIIARGKITRKHLSTLPIEPKKIVMCADTAFSMKIDEGSTRNPLKDLPDLPLRSRKVGICPSSVVWKKCKKNRIDYPFILAEFIDKLIEEKEYNIVIIPHAIRINTTKNMNNDLNICKEVFERVRNKDRCHIITRNYEPEELRLAIRAMDFMVVSRFHAMVSSLAEKIPTLVIGWSHKYQEVLDMFHLKGFALDTKDLSLSNLIKKFEEIEQCESEIKYKIGQSLPYVIMSSKRNYQYVKEVINDVRRGILPKTGKVIDYEHYLGKVDRSFLGYSSNPKIRKGAASGGCVSALLIYLLEHNYIDGALVSRTVANNDVLNVETFIARSAREILDSQTSIYMDFPYHKAIERLKKENGKFAVVGLPCHLKILELLEKSNPKLSDKIVFKVGLFCGHTSKKELLLKVLEKKGIKEKDIKKIYFRKGHWKGQMEIHLKNGEKKAFPFNHFGVYQNLWWFAPRKCLWCDDHTAELSDISFGDIWKKEMKKNPIKHSIIISRNWKGSDILRKMEREKKLVLRVYSTKEIFSVQKMSLFNKKKCLAGRVKLGKRFGFNPPQTLEDYKNRSRWNDVVGAFFILLHVKMSEDPAWREIIFNIPKPICYLYMAFTKLWHNF